MTTNFNIQEHQYKSCIECFEDTIASYVERTNKKEGLTGGEIYQAFKQAIHYKPESGSVRLEEQFYTIGG